MVCTWYCGNIKIIIIKTNYNDYYSKILREVGFTMAFIKVFNNNNDDNDNLVYVYSDKFRLWRLVIINLYTN